MFADVGRPGRLVALAALAALVVLGGCVDAGMPDPGDAASPTPPSTADRTATPAPTAGGTSTTSVSSDASTSETGTTTATTTPQHLDTNNPWNERVLTVGIAAEADPNRDYATLARLATEAWNRSVSRYTSYDLAFVVRPSAADPEVELRFVADIADCGKTRQSQVVGCAPLINATDDPPETADVRIEAGHRDAATVGTIRHELGHILGLDHDAAPQILMAHRAERDLPDADDRSHPWPTSRISVFLAADEFDDPAATRRQVAHARTFFNDSAQGTVPSNLSLVPTADGATADVRIHSEQAHNCPSDGGSNATVYGEHADGDGEMESYTGLHVCLSNLDVDARGWHTASWLAYGFGLASEERPEVLRSSASYETRRSDWWA